MFWGFLCASVWTWLLRCCVLIFKVHWIMGAVLMSLVSKTPIYTRDCLVAWNSTTTKYIVVNTSWRNLLPCALPNKMRLSATFCECGFAVCIRHRTTIGLGTASVASHCVLFYVCVIIYMPLNWLKWQLRTALFWFITQRFVVIYFRRFGTTFRSHPQGFRIQKKVCCPNTELTVAEEN